MVVRSSDSKNGLAIRREGYLFTYSQALLLRLDHYSHDDLGKNVERISRKKRGNVPACYRGMI